MKRNNIIEQASQLKSISEYYLSVKLQEIEKMADEGESVINLGVGNPDLPPSEYVVDELCRVAAHSDIHGYQPCTGIPELKEAYASWYNRFFNVKLSTSEVLPISGPKEGIMQISLAFLNLGDGVLIPNPGHPSYTSVSKLLNANIIPYDLVESNNWLPDFEALEKMDLSGVKLMWVNYPNMPTGANASTELFEQLVAFGKKHSIVICHDNSYSFILNNRPLSILQVKGAKDICIELNSMSNSHNMAGWRMGMLASNKKFVKWVIKVKSNIDCGQFKPKQLATIVALDTPMQWHDNMNLLYGQRRLWAYKIMSIMGCTYNTNQVGFFVWAKIPDHEKSSKDLVDDLLYKARVFVTPGFIYGSNGDRYIRMSLGSSATNIKEAYERIADFLVSRSQ